MVFQVTCEMITKTPFLFFQSEIKQDLDFIPFSKILQHMKNRKTKLYKPSFLNWDIPENTKSPRLSAMVLYLWSSLNEMLCPSLRVEDNSAA